ncbi:MAG: hypothetical protein NVV59_02950 [Chitinophagaceae bacterium]|nr:hypothetical protein [Chitinophagaceae bacterium]
MDTTTLGIGTRLQHTQFGPGVIVGIKYATYIISFIHHGIKEIDKTDPQLDDIIPENVSAEVETQSEAEISLLKNPASLGRPYRSGSAWRPLERWHNVAATSRCIVESERSSH